QWQRVHRGPGVHAAWHGAGNRSGSGGAGGDGALAGRAAGPPDGQQGGKGAGAGVLPGRSPDKAEGRIRGGPANSHHRDQPPYRLANPLPYPLSLRERGNPGCASLTRATGRVAWGWRPAWIWRRWRRRGAGWPRFWAALRAASWERCWRWKK